MQRRVKGRKKKTIKGWEAPTSWAHVHFMTEYSQQPLDVGDLTLFTLEEVSLHQG